MELFKSKIRAQFNIFIGILNKLNKNIYLSRGQKKLGIGLSLF